MDQVLRLHAAYAAAYMDDKHSQQTPRLHFGESFAWT